MDRRNFFGATVAAVLGLLGWKAVSADAPFRKIPVCWAPELDESLSDPIYAKGLVMENPADSGCVMYLDTGDFLQPGEWFAIPKSWCAFRVYPRPESGVAAHAAV